MRAPHTHIRQISRLPHQAAFALLRASGKKWVTDSFVLQVIEKVPSKKPRPEQYGVCITVSKRAAKSAVTRNRMRRRLLAVARVIIPAHALENFDYNLSARSNAATRDMAQMEKDLLWALKKIEMTKS